MIVLVPEHCLSFFFTDFFHEQIKLVKILQELAKSEPKLVQTSKGKMVKRILIYNEITDEKPS